MTLLAKVNDDNDIVEYPYSFEQLRADHPGTSFPEGTPSEELLAEFGVRIVISVGLPELAANERAVEDQPVKTENGWEQRFTVAAIPVEELRAAIPPISRAQAKLALLAAGKLAKVEQVLSELAEPDKTAAMINWNDRSQFERNHPFIEEMRKLIGMTPKEVDALFTYGLQL